MSKLKRGKQLTASSFYNFRCVLREFCRELKSSFVDQVNYRWDFEVNSCLLKLIVSQFRIQLASVEVSLVDCLFYSERQIVIDH